LFGFVLLGFLELVDLLVLEEVVAERVDIGRGRLDHSDDGIRVVGKCSCQVVGEVG
jgi:hypothetical protein